MAEKRGDPEAKPRKKHGELELGTGDYLSTRKNDSAYIILQPIYGDTGVLQDYKYLYLNDVFLRHTGFKLEDLLGKTAGEILSTVSPAWLKFFAAVSASGQPQKSILFCDISSRWHEVYCHPYDKDKIGVQIWDVTKTFSRQEGLHQSRERYKAFMMASFDSVYLASPSWGELAILKDEGGLADKPTADAQWLRKHILPKDWLPILRAIRKVLMQKSRVDMEHQFIMPDGSAKWIQTRAVPIFNKGGEITEWLGAASDITLRKEFEIKMLEKEKEYLELLDSSYLGSFIVDFIEKECHVSGTWKKRLGLEDISPEALFNNSTTIFHPEDARRLASIKKNHRKESRYEMKYRIRTKDSEEVWVLGQVKVKRDGEGNPLKAYGTQFDITKKKLAENILIDSEKKSQKLIAKLRQADAHKNNFIATLSHELRNPLAAISMGVSMLDYFVPGGEQDRRTRDIIRRQTDQLVRLVNDLLDVAKIKSNRVAMDRARIDMVRMVRETLDEYRDDFQAKGIVLEEKFCASPLFIVGDLGRLKQATGNLLSNAHKFTEPGGTVRVEAKKDKKAPTAVIKVRDTGIGIAPHMLPDLFEPFLQINNSLARDTSGLGLGLSIVKGIVELHGGSVSVKSKGCGKGSEIELRVPLSGDAAE